MPFSDEDKFTVKKVFLCLFIASACFALTHLTALLFTVHKSITNNLISGNRHVFVYFVCFISIDFFLVITYPLQAYYRWKENWPAMKFDLVLCSFYQSLEPFYLYCHPLILTFLWYDYYRLISRKISRAKRKADRSACISFLHCLLSVVVSTGFVVPAYLYSQLAPFQISDKITKIKCLLEDIMPNHVAWITFSTAFALTYILPLCMFVMFSIITENQRSRPNYRSSYRSYRKWLITYSVLIFVIRSTYWFSYAVPTLRRNNVVEEDFLIYIIVNVLRFMMSPLWVCIDPFFCLILACNVQNF